MAPRRGRAFWQRLISKFERSDEEQRAFAARHGVNLETFRTWLYKLRDEGARRESSSVRVLPVAVTGVGTSGISIEVGDLVLRVTEGVDAAYVASIVQALRATC